MNYTIMDCYSDEPSGLGVPPYLGTYPRYLFGALHEHKPKYLTIDDVRAIHKKKLTDKSDEIKTNTKVYNLTRSVNETKNVLNNTDVLIISGGIQTPGKYLSGVPGTFFEISKLISDMKCKKILVGPAASMGTRLEGGKKQESIPKSTFTSLEPNFMGFDDYKNIDEYSVKGAAILKQIPYPVMIELESGRGCPMHCSFCTEPLKYGIEDREPDAIIDEVHALKSMGAEHYRFGKATCFYTYGKKSPERMKTLLEGIKKTKPTTLHIDNANPNMVTEELTKMIVKNCTPGNTAAFGVESFDMQVVKANHLNCTPETALKAIRIINKYGAAKGENGLPKLLPGINLLFGLLNERKESHAENMRYLQQIIDEKLLLRRINIRQVVSFDGTYLSQNGGIKFVKKNKKHYWKWRNDIRQNIDLPMLNMLVPLGTILKDVRMEIYDGNTTFGRQWGTYPLIVGVKGRLPLGKSFDIKVTKHMLRSVTGEVVSN